MYGGSRSRDNRSKVAISERPIYRYQCYAEQNGKDACNQKREEPSNGYLQYLAVSQTYLFWLHLEIPVEPCVAKSERAIAKQAKHGRDCEDMGNETAPARFLLHETPLRLPTRSPLLQRLAAPGDPSVGGYIVY